MKKLVPGSLFLLLSLSLAVGSQVCAAPDVTELLNKADKLMQTDHIKQAEITLREVIRLSPDNSIAHMQLGKTLASQAASLGPGKAKESADLYETAVLEEQQAIKLDPKQFGAHVALGQIYANTGKHEASISELQIACEIKPASYGAHRDLGIACLTAGKVDEAIDALKKASSLKPERPEAHMKLAILLAKRGSEKEALVEANEAVKLSPKDPETHIALANIMLDSGDAAGSIPEFKIALSIAKNHPNALSGMGYAIAKRNAPGDIDSGIDHQRRAIASAKFFLPSYVRLAELLASQGKNKEAEEQYKAALRINPDDAGVGTEYAKFLEKNGRKDEAQAVLKRVLDKTPHFKAASDALAGMKSPGRTK